MNFSSRLLLSSLLIALGSQPSLAKSSCVVKDGQFAMSDTAPAANAMACTYKCLVLRGGEQVDVSCKVNLNTGDTGQCTAAAQPGDTVIGAASACGNATPPKFDGPVTGAAK